MSKMTAAAVAAIIFGITFGITFGLSGAASAQQPAAPAAQSPAPPQRDFSKTEIKTTDLGHDTYMLQGEGGNMTIAVGANGVIMVDSEFAPLHDRIKAAIDKITNQPIKFLVNTHFHGDHAGGDALFHKDGAIVVAQKNVKARLAAGTTNGLTGVKTPPAEPDALPNKSFGREKALKVKGRLAFLGHPANAHTDGDTYVLFQDANVLATGDIFTNGRYPNIDFANGGNIKGMIAGAEIFLSLVNDQTKIVPGHGPLAGKADLEAYLTMLTTARDRMAKLVKDGKTEDEVVAAKSPNGRRPRRPARTSSASSITRSRISPARRRTGKRSTSAYAHTVQRRAIVSALQSPPRHRTPFKLDLVDVA